MALDWTAAMDDLMTERLRTCTLCGAVARRQDIRSVGCLALCACLCQRCLDQHGWPAVDTLLAQRYA